MTLLRYLFCYLAVASFTLLSQSMAVSTPSARPSVDYQKQPLDGPLAESVNAFIEEMREAADEEDVDWLMDHWNFRGMVEMLADEAEDEKLASFLRENVDAMLEKLKPVMKQFMVFDQFVFHRVTRLEADAKGERVIVWVLTRDADDIYLRTKFWLRKSEDTWQIIDTEEANLGVRTSNFAKGVMAQLSESGASKAIGALLKTVVALASGDLEKSRRLLDTIKDEDLGRDFNLLVGFLNGSLWLADEEPAKALEVAATLKTLDKKGVAAEELSRNAHYMLGNYQLCFDAAKVCIDFHGADPELILQAVDTLRAMKRDEDAVQFLKQGLLEFPEDPLLLEALPNVMSPAQLKPFLAAGLAATEDADGLLERLLDAYTICSAPECYLSLIEAVKAWDAKHALLEEYERETAIREAVARFLKADDLAPVVKEFFNSDRDDPIDLEEVLQAYPSQGLLATADKLVSAYENEFPKALVDRKKIMASLLWELDYRATLRQPGCVLKTPLAQELEAASTREETFRRYADAAVVIDDMHYLRQAVDALDSVEKGAAYAESYRKQCEKAEAEAEKAEKQRLEKGAPMLDSDFN
jgi:hypothetical protein